ncbi:MAG: hypothetical protein HY892_13685 [Deltaproteobacteria bacterium]|nr:hypothetical protein [Deltaproteobacteria bacterium]
MKQSALTAIIFLIFVSTVWAAPPDWAGHWEFTECWPHLDKITSNCIEYRLDIRRVETGYTVDVDADGFQTMRRLQGEGRVDRNALEIIFRSVGEEDLRSDFKPGDILFTLKKQQGGC